jgi:hypothetical protein
MSPVLVEERGKPNEKYRGVRSSERAGRDDRKVQVAE